MNLVARQIFGNTSSIIWNTSIGGVSASITTASALATKLGISVAAISNFTIVGSDVNCRITGSYVCPNFSTNTEIIYYFDNDNLITSINSNVFQNAVNLTSLKIEGVTTITGGRCFENTKLTFLNLPNLISAVGIAFVDGINRDYKKVSIYIPICATFGNNVNIDESVLRGVFPVSGNVFYLKPSLATINSGGEEADVASARAAGGIIRYVTNLTAPNPVTTLVAGTIYNTAVQLNFTPPTGSTNAIEFYECYADGVRKNDITASGQYITGLTVNTSYNITIIAVDTLYNKSVVSNSLSVSTSNRSAVDADAIAYVSASSNTTYQDIIDDLYVSLKSNSLYTKLQAFYPFLGATAAQHKWNGKNPLDTNAAFRLTFSGGATFSDLGYTPNGTTGFANTYLTPSVSQTLNSNGMTVVSGTDSGDSGDNWIIAAYNSGTQNSILKITGNGAFNLNGTRINGSSALGMKGIFTNTKQSATVSKLFKNGVEKFSGNSGGTLPTNPFYIGAIGNIVYGYTRERIQFVAIHEGLSDAEVSTLHTIIDTFETALGRNV